MQKRPSSRSTLLFPPALLVGAFCTVAVFLAGPAFAGAARPTDRGGVSKRLSDSDWVKIRAAYKAHYHRVAQGNDENRATNPEQQQSETFVDPIAQQQAYIKASNTGGSDMFGAAVAMSGDTVVIGAPEEDGDATGVNGNQNGGTYESGAAYVFVRDGATWHQQAYLKASNTGFNDRFGYSVAIDGDTIVIGARGEDSWATGVNGDQNLSNAFSAGAAYVFVRNGETWSQQAYLKASNTQGSDFFGHSVAISGNTIVVGALGEDSSAREINGNQNDNSAPQAGAAYVFVRSGNAWSQQAYLKGSNTAFGYFFGSSVSISDDTVVVGAHRTQITGAAYVFVRNGSTWAEQAYLRASNPDSFDMFGAAVSISGNTLVVGAPEEASNGGQSDNSTGAAGAAYIFVREGSTWTQQAYLKASNTNQGDNFGRSVAISGEAVVIGASLEDSNAAGIDGNQADNSATDSGAAYVFVRNGDTWSQQAYLKASNTDASDQLGYAVAISSDTVVVGATLEDSLATGVNGSQGNDFFDTGASYIFSLTTVVSQKDHGGAPVGIHLPLSVTGSSALPAIECRSGQPAAGDHTVIFSFINPLIQVAGVSVSPGIGGAGVVDWSLSRTPATGIGPAANQYTVNLTNVSNQQRLTVTLTGVTDATGNTVGSVPVTIGLLSGDVTGNGAVTNTDVAAVKEQVSAPITDLNFRADITANGAISNTDVSLIKGQVGTSLP